MAKKAAQLPESTNPASNGLVVVSINGASYKVQLSNLVPVSQEDIDDATALAIAL